MKKYFTIQEWDLGLDDYLNQIDSENIDYSLDPYLDYIYEDSGYRLPIESVSTDDGEGGSNESTVIPILPKKEDLPVMKHVNIPEDETKGKSTIVNEDRTDFKDRRDFIKHFAALYKSEGLNDDLALTLAKQDALESWTKKGLSTLAKGYKNYGGIKAVGNQRSVTMDTDEYINGNKKRISDRFRVFDSDIDYVRNKIKWLRGSKNFPGALDGDGDHYLDVITGNNPLGRKYATAPNYKEVLRGIKAKFGGVLKAQRGVLLNNYNVDGDHYDYSSGAYDPESGHWASRDPETGIIAKSPKHDTHHLSLEGEYEAGMRRFRNKFNGREYTFDELEANTKGLMPGMEEIGYHDDLYDKSLKELYGNALPKAKEYYNYLIDLGARDVEAAALVGVFMQESSLNHKAVSSKGATGVAQLLGDKKRAYDSWLKKNGKADTAKNQIRWVWDHMATAKDNWHDYYLSLYTHSRNDFKDLLERDRAKARSDWDNMKDSKYAEYNYDAFRDTFYGLKDAGDAAEWFTWTFERPRDDEANMERRKALANYLLKYMRYVK